jgi:hypothetical protein
LRQGAADCPPVDDGETVSARLPHSLLDGVLKLRAEEYAATLDVGATVDANDRVYLDGTEWGRFFDDALSARGLQLDGDTVVPRWKETGT